MSLQRSRLPKTIKCEICSKKISNYNYTGHFRTHDTSLEMYLKEYDNRSKYFTKKKSWITVDGIKLKKHAINLGLSKLNIKGYSSVRTYIKVKALVDSSSNVPKMAIDKILRRHLDPSNTDFNRETLKEFIHRVNSIIEFKGLRAENREWITLTRGHDYYENTLKRKIEAYTGRNNPAYNHGGTYSPFSKKFVGTATIEATRKKMLTSKKVHPENDPLHIEYYLKQGLSLPQAKSAFADRQSTFSLRKCKERYGDIEGQRVWQERQNKWQKTLKALPEEEIKRINFLKGTSSGFGLARIKKCPKLAKEPSILYYIRFHSPDTGYEFWKIGITKFDVLKRFGSSALCYEKHNLKYDVIYVENDTWVGCFNKEQAILKEHRESRIPIDYNGFKTTEAFSKNINEII